MKKIPPKLTLSSRISTRHLRQYVNVVGHHHSDVYELWFWFSHLQHSTHEAVRPYGISHTVLSIHFRWRVENIFCAVTTIEKMFKVMRSICLFCIFYDCELRCMKFVTENSRSQFFITSLLSEFYLILFYSETTSSGRLPLAKQCNRKMFGMLRFDAECICGAHLKLGFTDFTRWFLYICVCCTERRHGK